MTIARAAERKLNNWLQDRKRNRKWKRERELALLPEPTQTWKSAGFLLEVYLVKSGFWWFGPINTLYRIGSLDMVRGEPGFSPYFSPAGSGELLKLLEKAERWQAMLANVNRSEMISADRWQAACNAMKPDSVAASTFSMKVDKVECHFAELANNRHRRPCKIIVPEREAQHGHASFFSLLDFPGVEDLLGRVWQQHCNRSFQVALPEPKKPEVVQLRENTTSNDDSETKKPVSKDDGGSVKPKSKDERPSDEPESKGDAAEDLLHDDGWAEYWAEHLSDGEEDWDAWERENGDGQVVDDDPPLDNPKDWD